jgi:hypothetical protein
MKEVGKYTYQLEPLPIMDIHPTFNVSLLELVHNNCLPGKIILTPAPVIIEGKPEYEVVEVLDCNGRSGNEIRIQGTRGRARARTWLGRLVRAGRG